MQPEFREILDEVFGKEAETPPQAVAAGIPQETSTTVPGPREYTQQFPAQQTKEIQAERLPVLEPPIVYDEVTEALRALAAVNPRVSSTRIVAEPDGGISIVPPEMSGAVAGWIMAARQPAVEAAAPTNTPDETERYQVETDQESRLGVIVGGVTFGVVAGILAAGGVMNVMDVQAHPERGEVTVRTFVNGTPRLLSELLDLVDR